MVDHRLWSLDDEPAQVVDLREIGALDYLVNLYGTREKRVLREVLAQAYRAGAQTAVVEFRYIDADYRDEHSAFYSTTFRRYPSVAHRIHFFLGAATDQLENPAEPLKFADLGYLGYLVARPVPGAPVGRVMMKPPAGLEAAVTCQAEEEVNLFGENLKVTGTPFMAQDAQLLRCAHAALWVVARHHHLTWGTPKLLPRAIVDAVPMEAGAGRTLPSPGLTVTQMSAAATRLGLPPLVYDLKNLAPGQSLQSIACRYLNGGLPVIVAGKGHAWVLVGYTRSHETSDDPRIVFIRQDDEAGPYQVVPDFNFDDYSPWQFLIVPLPSKLYVPGEEAELVGQRWLTAAFARDGLTLDPKTFAFRTTAMLSNDFKNGLEDRGVPPAQATTLRRASMSRWIWVVEAVERSLRRKNEPAVFGEVIVDATDHARDRRPLAWRTPASVTVFTPDSRQERTATSSTPTVPLRFAREGLG
ncbi:MAG: hypothetical protein JWR52_1061 [Marmoricola sp.]|nr:hypothetical protein [Marmoricola sp.]